MSGAGHGVVSVVRRVELLLLAVAIAAIAGACARRSPMEPGAATSMRITAVLPPRAASPAGVHATRGTAGVAASVDSMNLLLLSVYEQTAAGENLLAREEHVPQSVDVPDSLLQWQVTVPWAFRYRIEVQASGTRYFSGDYNGYTSNGLQYLGEAVVDVASGPPDQVTIGLRDVVPRPWTSYPAASVLAQWGPIPGAVGYSIRGMLWGQESYSYATVAADSMDMTDWSWVQVATRLPHGLTSAYSYRLNGGTLAARAAAGR